MSWLSLFGLGRYFEPVTGHTEPEPDPDALTIDGDGWLVGAGVKHYPSVRSNPLTTLGEIPLGIVLHYTATDHGTAESLAKRIRTFDRIKDRAASWNIIIAANGIIYQSVSLERGSWHCAKGRLDGHTINRSTIGVELEGHGKAILPAPQVDGLRRFYRAVLPHYRIPRDRAVLEHRTFDPTRRADPGDHVVEVAKRLVAEVAA
jgi:N-acetyl-anhydromuramyl-L-alanine amidase AmpD